METLTFWAGVLLRLAAPASVAVAAQLFLKPKSEAAAKWVTLSASLALVRPMWDALWPFLSTLSLLSPLKWMVHTASPLLSAAAVAGIAWGLVQLIDEANPPRVTLPPALETAQGVGANKFALVFWLVGGGLAILGSQNRLWAENDDLYAFGLPPVLMRYLPLAGYFVALALIQYAAWRVQQHGGLAKWVLTRRPQDVLWAYAHQLTVKRNGSVTGVHWSALVSTASGYRVGLTAIGKEHAHALVLAISQHCPGVLLGFSAEVAAAYAARRKALAQQATQQATPTTLR